MLGVVKSAYALLLAAACLSSHVVHPASAVPHGTYTSAFSIGHRAQGNRCVHDFSNELVSARTYLTGLSSMPAPFGRPHVLTRPACRDAHFLTSAYLKHRLCGLSFARASSIARYPDKN